MSESVEQGIASKIMKNAGLGTVLNGIFTLNDYKTAKEQGYSTGASIAKAAGTNIMMNVIGPGKYTMMQLGMELPSLAVKGYEALSQQARAMSIMGTNKPFQNSTFVDTQQNYTMRQAGMQLAKASQYNTQQAMLGQEANFLHM